MIKILLLVIGIQGFYGACTASTAISGATVCTNLTISLGSGKVSSNPLDLRYISSREGYWNALQSIYQPSCIIYPTSAQDVSIALQAIRVSDSRFAVKAGGHNTNNFFSSVDNGVLIDLSSLDAKSYDPSSTLAIYEPGSTFGELYDYYAQFGRTVLGPTLAGVGTGAALGGGLSYLSSQYGMACDDFRELEVVLPSGEIVIASPEFHTDLFFGLRGGGGNAYGIVTRYTVQSRPVDQFLAGNLVYLFEQNDAVVDAIQAFMQYNPDPKASIVATYLKLPTPDLNLNLDEAILMFLVYDGFDASDVFNNFTSIPYLLNTLSIKTYPEVINMPIPFLAQLTRGDNTFRVGVHRVINDDSYKTAIVAWRNWAEANKGTYELLTFDYEPVPKSLTDASNSQNGGNAMQMPDGPWFWISYILETPPGMSQADYDAVQASFAEMVDSVDNAEDLPLFINDASFDQNPLATFSTYSELQQIKAKYDPDGFFAQRTGGWSLA
jgi:FAD/FMN-containing dehydrogenase